LSTSRRSSIPTLLTFDSARAQNSYVNRVNANYVIVPPHGCLTFEVTTPGAFRQARPPCSNLCMPLLLVSHAISFADAHQLRPTEPIPCGGNPHK
jgi:hypothetical protein